MYVSALLWIIKNCQRRVGDMAVTIEGHFHDYQYEVTSGAVDIGVPRQRNRR